MTTARHTTPRQRRHAGEIFGAHAVAYSKFGKEAIDPKAEVCKTPGWSLLAFGRSENAANLPTALKILKTQKTTRFFSVWSRQTKGKYRLP